MQARPDVVGGVGPSASLVTHDQGATCDDTGDTG